MSRHTDLIDFVNYAETEIEHLYADVFLAGWRAGQAEAGRRWSYTEADAHSSARFPGRQLCCGVLVDWAATPTSPTPPAGQEGPTP